MCGMSAGARTTTALAAASSTQTRYALASELDVTGAFVMPPPVTV